MRRSRPWSSDLDVVDVLIVEDEKDEDVAVDELRDVLHELALESMAWRATWPGEERPLPGSPTSDPFPEPASLARRIAMRYRRRAVTAAALAVAVAATTAVVDARQTAARAAAFAAMPAVLAQASDPPSEEWRLPGRVVGDLDDRLLVVDAGSLRSVDPVTGRVDWAASPAAGHAATNGHCFPVDEGLLPGRAPVADDAGPRGLVACAAGVPGAPSPGDGHDGEGAGARARVVVLDASTGRTRHTVAVGGTLLLAEPVGRDLLVATALEDGRAGVARWDLEAGTPRWRGLSPGPVVAAGVPTTVQRRPDSLTVGAFAVDLTSGEELDAVAESSRPFPYEEHVLPGGARVTWAWQRDGTSGRGWVRGGDAAVSSVLPGRPLLPAVTDGSHAGTLAARVARGDRLRGLDVRTGRMRWSQHFPGAAALRATALVDGVLLVTDGDDVTAIDVGTGTTRWRAPVDAAIAGASALTDGQLVLLPTRAGDGGVDVTAHRIADGTPVWQASAPPGTTRLTVVDHHLVASTAAEVIGLR